MVIHWFRRDLRIQDNVALFHALSTEKEVLPVFIFDPAILDGLAVDDARVTCIHQSILALNVVLKKRGSGMQMYYGDPVQIFSQLVEELDVEQVYCAEDYEPSTIRRDAEVEKLLSLRGIPFRRYKDHLICHPNELLKNDGQPYKVFTPYFRKWLPLAKASVRTVDSESIGHYVPLEPKVLSLEEIGFEPSSISWPKPDSVDVSDYDTTRDFPAKETTRVGLALRFGTISIRQLFLDTVDENTTYVSELAWRDFFSQIVYHYPQVIQQAFKPQYDKIEWLNDEQNFKLWKEGKTGYPIVDAGMRELQATGHMHNRVRMITASFLVKHLLIDWRWGEAYFAEKLLDFDLASNNGNWQWIAGSGCDAAPYFRVFNPESQRKRFDPNFEYVKKWVPEFADWNYTRPIVEHKYARERALMVYKKALG